MTLLKISWNEFHAKEMTTLVNKLCALGGRHTVGSEGPRTLRVLVRCQTWQNYIKL